MLDLGRGSNGKRRRRKLTAKTKTEVKAKLQRAKDEQAQGITAGAATQTVATYLDRWVDDVPASDITEGTRSGYRDTIRRYITPEVGSVKLRELTPEHVRQMLRALEAKGLSANTRKQARAVLRRALRFAEQDGLVVRNAAAVADGPKLPPHKTDDALTEDQVRQVLAKGTGDRLYALAVVTLTLGLRSGEARALRWSDVDFDAGELTVSATLSQVAGGGLERKVPKTDSSARTIPMPDVVATALRRHRKAQAAEALAAKLWLNDEGYVFTTTIGTPIDRYAALKWWRKLCKDTGVPARRFHATRHTAAVLLLERGVPLEVVSAILGHSSLAITADVYAKVTKDSMRRALASHDVMHGS